MDPATVLGVVAAAIQFVDFSSKLISRTYTIYTSSSGELCDKQRGATIAGALRNLNGEIKRCSETAIRTTTVRQDDSDLLELCDGCNDVARELLDALSKLSVDKAKRRAWESFRVALQSIWSKDAIDSLERRLSAYREHIALHMLWGLRRQLEDGLQNLALEQRQTREELLRLVSEHQDWQKNVIAAISAAPRPRVAPGSADQTRFVQLLLRQLHFQRISNREDKIPNAHQATFEWVFRPPNADQRPWADFGNWLGSDSSIYWITGKAGAGKSTLMKFIGNDSRTNEILKTSAGDRRLVIARFYFWNSGTELQMTQEGLLRTLIHDILEQCQDLAITAFPQRWELFQLFGIHDPEPAQYVELQRQLDQIITANASTQFVFFIDGLDEFLGDHADLAAYAKRLSDNANTKVCVSSRPWNVFEDAFASTPSLRVEDLTYPDVVRFIESSFDESPGYEELRMESPLAAEELLHAIASKASGVFLWVSLVVKSLLIGMTNGEKLPKLRDHLDSLPLDLEQLFQKMLDQIKPTDLENSSRLFQIVRAAHQPPTVMTLAWADEDEPNFPFTRAIEPLSPDERNARSRRMRRRLKSHCAGLLEAQRSLLSDGTVEFLHRTVRDFLYRDDVWSKLQSFAPRPFHPAQALCRSYLLQFKCMDVGVELVHESLYSFLTGKPPYVLSHILTSFISYAHAVYKTTGDTLWQLYDELAKTTKFHFDRGQSCTLATQPCWCQGPADHDDGPFLSLAIALRIAPYVEACLKRRPPRKKESQKGRTVLQEAIYSEYSVSEPWEMASCYKINRYKFLGLLLGHGADPNLSTLQSPVSAWEILVSRQFEMSPDTFVDFLHHGADPWVNLEFIHVMGSSWEPVQALQAEIQQVQKEEQRAEKRKQKAQKRKELITRIQAFTRVLFCK